MILKPMVRNNICINCHPLGCAAVVRKEIAYTKNALSAERPAVAPRLVLIIGCSTGYGLASRIAAAFGYGAATVGISFEKAATPSKPGTPGYYNNLTFDSEAAKAGLPALTLDGDAFSNKMKEQTVEALKDITALYNDTAAKNGAAKLTPQVDLVIYSLASPVRTDPRDGVMYRSVIKPIGRRYSGKTIDMMTGRIITLGAEPATEEEIAHTVKVMGGEDWELWIDALDKAGVLSAQARTLAYTYIGPELSWAIYKNGTIGKAKEDLERAGKALNKKFAASPETAGRRAWVSVNKGLVTRASAVIPIIPFYISCLFKVMKTKGIHEGCIEQITRLYRDRLYAGEAALDPAKVPTDSEGRIRIDDWEMREDVQQETLTLMNNVTEENVLSVTDIEGFKHDFLEAHGFDVPGIDYGADIDPEKIG
ncbi:MAG: trans-2-enoyl-CoA reductase family protein [Treponema sp.]|nr:trans-2-enoyl-CoA reductase family protein [Treponema sp.]